MVLSVTANAPRRHHALRCLTLFALSFDSISLLYCTSSTGNWSEKTWRAERACDDISLATFHNAFTGSGIHLDSIT